MNGWNDFCRRVLIALFILYALLCLCVFIWQRGLLYVPTQIPMATIGQVAADNGFVPWTNPAGQIIGWRVLSNRPTVGSVLILHGNAGCAVGRDYLAQPIHAAEAMEVFVLEYPGYGARAGTPCKKSFDAAAEEAFALLPADKPKYLVSESLGRAWRVTWPKGTRAKSPG